MDKAESQEEKAVKNVGPYAVGRTIGSGTSGKVKLGTHSVDGSKVAIKFMRKDAINVKQSLRKKVEREIAILKLIDHPHVLKMIDVYENDAFLFIILEYVEGGELFDYLISKGKLELNEALTFFQQIIMGLEYCQSLMICHRDLKPENLLLDSKKNIKIADFGMAALNMKGSMLQTSCGSPHYASPQVVQGVKYNGMQTDIWSCGVILYALIFGRLPFDDGNMKKLLQKVKSGVFHMPEDTDPQVKDLVNRMLTVEPDRRITIDEIKSHPWFRSNNNSEALAPQLDRALLASTLKMDALDWEIISDLQTLGWGSEDDIFPKLLCKELTLEKVYYYLIEKKKKERPKSSTSAQGRRLTPNLTLETRANRSMSESQGYPKFDRQSTELNCASPKSARASEDPQKPRSWFRYPFFRFGFKSENNSHSPSPKSLFFGTDEFENSPRTPSSTKSRDGDEPSTPESSSRSLRKKILPDLVTSSPVMVSSPKPSWANQITDASLRSSYESSMSSSPSGMQNSPQFTPTRKISMTRTSGFLVNRRHSETLSLLHQSLKQADVTFQTQDANTLICRWNRNETCDFKVTLMSVVDNSSHVVKFQRMTDDIYSFDTVFDQVQRSMRST